MVDIWCTADHALRVSSTAIDRIVEDISVHDLGRLQDCHSRDMQL